MIVVTIIANVVHQSSLSTSIINLICISFNYRLSTNSKKLKLTCYEFEQAIQLYKQPFHQHNKGLQCTKPKIQVTINLYQISL